MIGIDTNVLVRYLVQDDETQSVLASRLIENSISVDKPGYITLISLVDVVWVLKSCYSVNKSKLCTMITTVLGKIVSNRTIWIMSSCSKVI